MLILYLGSGKGKTTAAFGLALRAAGWGKKVAIFQFVKEKKWPEGLRQSIEKSLCLRKLVKISVLGTGFVGIMGDKKPLAVHKKAAQDGIIKVIKVIKSFKPDLIICDELLGALHGKLIKRKEVENILSTVYGLRTTLIRKKKAVVGSRSAISLVFTGRHAPEWLIAKADLVTEMKEIKHPFQKGEKAQRGIDF